MAGSRETLNLATDYMGLRLRNPLVASSSPMSATHEGVQRLAAGGVGAVVLYSLFQEQLRAEPAALIDPAAGPAGAAPGSVDHVPAISRPEAGPEGYLRLLEQAVAAVEIPVIGSLSGTTPESWTDYARAMEEAGAAAIELNIYYLPPDPDTLGEEVEERHLQVLTRVKSAVSVPVAVKLSPYFSSIGEMAMRLDQAGADGIVLFNRFLQPDVDPEELMVLPRVTLSSPADGRLPRAWIALLRGRIGASLAASTGVEVPGDLARCLLAGADVVMTASALLRHGPRYAGALLDGLSTWMVRKGFQSLDQVRGLLADRPGPAEPDAPRAGYIAALRAANAGAYAPW